MPKTNITNKSGRYSFWNPYNAIQPINIPHIRLTIIKSFFLGYLSTKVPAYNPQNNVRNVIIIN